MNPYKYVTIAREIFNVELSAKRQNAYHVSLVIVNKSIIGVGVNGLKSHPYMISYGRERIYMHSEVAAWQSSRFITDKDKTLINFRFNPRGELRLSRPCKDCLKLCIREFSTVYYSTNSATIERLY